MAEDELEEDISMKKLADISREALRGFNGLKIKNVFTVFCLKCFSEYNYNIRSSLKS